jgi:hypothetical protein
LASDENGNQAALLRPLPAGSLVVEQVRWDLEKDDSRFTQ